jgi:hypothetical protein
MSDISNALLVQAYLNAIGSGGSTLRDPIRNVYFDGNNTFDHTSGFGFLDIDNLDGDTINIVNIQNAATLFPIMILGDEMGVFRVADAVLKYVTMGRVDVESSSTATRVYNYMKLRDERTSAEERAMFYKQVFNLGPGQTMNDMAVNQNFGPLWETLLSEVARFISKYERVDHPDLVSRFGIEQAVLNLQHNLSRATSGMVKIYVPEMYAHLEDAIQIINAEELRDQLGHGISRDLWNVVESVSAQEFGYYPNTTALRIVAAAGRKVLLSIASYSRTGFGEAEFQEFIRNAEAVIIGQSQLDGGGNYPTQGYIKEKEDLMEDTEDELEMMEEDWDF